MSGSYESLAQRLYFFAGQIRNACNLGTWCFGLGQNLYYTTSSFEAELHLYLQISGCLDMAMAEGEQQKTAFVLADRIGLTWVGDFAVVDDGTKVLILLGPLFHTNVSAKSIERSMQKMDLSLKLRNNFLRIFRKLPILTLDMVSQYANMLRYTIKEEGGPESPVYLVSSAGATPSPNEGDGRESIIHEREYRMEQTLLQHVREGNIDFEQGSENAEEEDFLMAAPMDYLTGDPQREARNNVIVFTALCTRAAIEGGIPIKTAKKLEQKYISKVEQTYTMAEMAALNWDMLKEFIRRVHDCRRNPQVSQVIRECCDYVHANYRKPLKLEDIAAEVGYTEYYLTKKFYKEMGIRLLDYVKDVKLEYAKILLLSSSKSIQEICDQLHFGTRNYFTRVFQMKTGMTPVEYRRKGRES